MRQENIGFGGVVFRLGAAVLLVLATFNPSGYSFYHWVAPLFPSFNAVQILAGVVLVIVWAVFLTATMRSLGLLGVSLLVALFAALTWVAVQYGWLRLDNTRTLAWISLIVAGLVLGVGMCWSFLRRALSGQADVDEVDSR